MIRRLFCLLILLSLMRFAPAQVNYEAFDFRQVDSFAKTIKYEHDYLKLVNDLTTAYSLDVYRARSIFRWITDNIQFDYRFINSGKELMAPDCENEPDCIGITREWENNYLKKILRTRRATSDGYTKLFKKFCDLVFISCEVIPGYARTKPYQVGNSMPVNHVWNAVMIDTSWYYVDITWAAGYCTEDEESGKLLKYSKDFKNYYWLNSFDRFSRNHYPKKGFFVERTNFSKEQFFNRPHYYSVEVLENITEILPRTGVIKANRNDTIHFAIEYRKPVSQIQVNSNIFRNPSLWVPVTVSKRKTKMVKDTWAEKKQVYIPFSRKGDLYQFDYVVTDNSLYYLELLFDYKQVIRYRIRTGK